MISKSIQFFNISLFILLIGILNIFVTFCAFSIDSYLSLTCDNIVSDYLKQRKILTSR